MIILSGTSTSIYIGGCPRSVGWMVDRVVAMLCYGLEWDYTVMGYLIGFNGREDSG